MAQIKEFELLHGIVLTKILRTNERTLRLVETDTKTAWAAYRINDSVVLYVKYRLGNRESARKQKLAWSFPFQSNELAKIVELQKDQPVWVALICGLPEIEAESLKSMQVCLLDIDQIRASIDLNAVTAQTIHVEYKVRESLRAYGKKNSKDEKKHIVPRNRLDQWDIPGS